MKKIILIINVFFTIASYAQQQDPVSWLVRCNKVVFHHADSCFLFTKLSEPNGYIHFHAGIQKSYEPIMSCHFISKNKPIETRLTTFVYEGTTIDTINSIFPDGYIHEDPYGELNDALFYSYLLIESGPVLPNSFRFVLPLEELNYCHSHKIFTVLQWQDSTVVLVEKYESVNYNGIVKVSSHTSKLKSRQVARLEKIVAQILEIDDISCLKDYNPVLLQFGSDYGSKIYWVSFDCLRDNKNKKNLTSNIFKLWDLIGSIDRRM